ncbi:MAG: hypothetical protein ACTSRP_07360 [Candidatus Helarchaeota archaeon]
MNTKKFVIYFLKFYGNFGKKELINMINDNYEFEEIYLICRNLNLIVEDSNEDDNYKKYDKKIYYVYKIVNYIDYLEEKIKKSLK